MNLYTLALFLHVSGAIGAFVSLGIWLFGLAALRRAQRVEQVRVIAWLIILASPLMVLSVLLIGLAGFQMALTTWGLQTPWIAVALIGVVLLAPIGPFVLDLRMRTIRTMIGKEADGPLPAALDQRIHDPILGTAAQTQATALLGIVFLMTTKPSLAISILVMSVAFSLGLISGVPHWYAAHFRAKRSSAHMTSTDGDPFQRTTLWTRRW
jgi:hypothetical protein